MIRGALLLAAMTLGTMSSAAAAGAGRPDALAGLAVHHVQVSVQDADALAAWYVQTLGFKVTKRAAATGLKIVWLDIPGFRLGLAQIPGSSRHPGGADEALLQGYRQVHFSVADVDRAYRALVDRGVRFRVAPTSYAVTGIRLATLSDPEGNLISLYQDIDPANPQVGNQPRQHPGDER